VATGYAAKAGRIGGAEYLRALAVDVGQQYRRCRCDKLDTRPPRCPGRKFPSRPQTKKPAPDPAGRRRSSGIAKLTISLEWSTASPGHAVHGGAGEIVIFTHPDHIGIGKLLRRKGDWNRCRCRCRKPRSPPRRAGGSAANQAKETQELRFHWQIISANPGHAARPNSCYKVCLPAYSWRQCPREWSLLWR